MDSIAVIPIFVSAGATVLPIIIGAIGSVLAVMFKPRELVSLCRRRPVAAIVSIVSVTMIVIAASVLLSGGSPSKQAKAGVAAGSVGYDWAKVATDLIAQEAAGVAPTTRSAGAVLQDALVLGRDFSRCSYDGGASPVGLKQRWRYQPEDSMFLSSPAAAGKYVYVAGCQSDLGGYTGLLACLDAVTGKPLWQITEVNGSPLKPFFSSPAISQDGRSLLIGQGLHEDADCSLLCFDATSGQLRWSVATPLHIESSPAIRGDLAVVGAGAIEGADGKPVGDPGFVLAVRISDGKELWRQAVNDPESSPAIDEAGMVYAGSGVNGSAVVAIRSETDQQLREKKLDRVAWRAELAMPVTSPITLAGDAIVVGAGKGDFVRAGDSGGLVVAIDRKTGRILWQAKTDAVSLGGIAYRDGLLACPMRNGEVVVLSAKDGTPLWRKSVSGKAPILAGCALTGEKVYAASNDGYLAVLNAKDGQLVEKIYLNDQAKPGMGLTTSTPQVAGGQVIVGSETGGLKCLTGTGADQ